MTNSNKLPITINAAEQLLAELNLSQSMLEKLEAWANFETLKANWYGDISLNLACKITLVNKAFFQQNFINTCNDNWQLNNEQAYAISEKNNFRNTSVIIPINELTGKDNKQNSAEAPWVETSIQADIQQQVTKVLNELAVHLKLPPLKI